MSFSIGVLRLPRKSCSKITPGTIDGDRLLANCGAGLVTVNFGLIFIAGLFPFDFSFQGTFSLTSLFSRFYGWSDSSDWILNIILFVPFGFSLALSMQKVPSGCTIRNALVVIASAGLSATVEILQLFLPGRFPAFVDIIANSTGGLVGVSAFGYGDRKS
jgi:glycopeptide antibiotics resistance protein